MKLSAATIRQIAARNPHFQRPQGRHNRAAIPNAACVKFSYYFNLYRGPGLAAEYRFAVPRRWRFDFAVPLALVAVEIEGGTFAGRPCRFCGQRSGGRHNRGAGFARDCEKYRAAAYRGWLVFRFTSEQVTPLAVMELAEFCAARMRQTAAQPIQTAAQKGSQQE